MLTIELLKAVVNNSNDGILIADYCNGCGPITFVNPAFESMTGYTSLELIGQDCRFLKGNDHEQAALNTLKKAVQNGEECTVKLRSYNKDGKLFWNLVKISYLKHGDKLTHIISFNRDVTREEYSRNVLEKVNVLYREMSKRLEYTNETDSLTKLKNRGHLSTRGEFILGAAKRERLRLHAIVIDIDNFKLLNSLTGEAMGDKCLIQIASIIKRYFSRTTDIAIRFCDDEFVVICIEDEDERVLERADKLREEVGIEFIEDCDGKKHSISVSIGVFSTTPDKHTTIENMVERAGQLVFQGSHGKQNHIAHAKANEFHLHSER